MRRAEILTPWTGTGASPADPFRPLVSARHPLASCVDTTSQLAGNLPPSPNLFVVEVVCTEAVLEAIAADPEFGPEAILSDEWLVASG